MLGTGAGGAEAAAAGAATATEGAAATGAAAAVGAAADAASAGLAIAADAAGAAGVWANTDTPEAKRLKPKTREASSFFISVFL